MKKKKEKRGEPLKEEENRLEEKLKSVWDITLKRRMDELRVFKMFCLYFRYPRTVKLDLLLNCKWFVITSDI